MNGREKTIPHRLLSAAGWLYERFGRERCDVCGGPLPKGEVRIVERGRGSDDTDSPLKVSLCRNCDVAYWVREEPETGENTEWYQKMMDGVFGHE